MVHVTEDVHGLEVRDDVSRGQRVVLFALGLIPLIAPYELLIRPNWQENSFGILFVIALIIGLGALIISGLFFAGALLGTSTRLRFDQTRRRLIIDRRTPLLGQRSAVIPFDEIAALRLEEMTWSEGEPSYALIVQTRGGQTYRMQSSSSKPLMEQTLQKVQAIVLA